MREDNTLNGIILTPSWKPNTYWGNLNVQNFTDYELTNRLAFSSVFSNGQLINDSQNVENEQISVEAKVQKLMLDMSQESWNMIKDYQPEVEVKRYAPSKIRGSHPDSGGGFKSLTGERQGIIPLTGISNEIYFNQEDYFRINRWYGQIFPKGKKSEWHKNVEQTFELRLRVTKNGKVIYSNNPLIVKLVAVLHRAALRDENTGEPIIEVGAEPYVSISYKIKSNA